MIWIPIYIVAAWISLAVTYYLFFALAYLLHKHPVASTSSTMRRFLVVIPAHNEEGLIADSIRSIKNMDYPSSLFDAIVIADNCGDSTEEVVQRMDVTCLSRKDSLHRGKGFALNWAFQKISLDIYDAIAIIDADTQADSMFLKEMNEELSKGHKVIQGYFNILNPNDSALTRLIEVTNIMRNRLLNAAKSLFGLPVPLVGNGMCFSTLVMARFGWKAYSIGEDYEYYGMLAEQGIFSVFSEKAIVYAQEANALNRGFHQRLRWSTGRFHAASQYGLKLLLTGLCERNFLKVDTALTLFIPNYSMLFNFSVFTLILTLVVCPLNSHRAFLITWLSLLLTLQFVYFVLGLIVMRAGVRTIYAIWLAPVFLVWRLIIDCLALLGYKKKAWIRTERN